MRKAIFGMFSVLSVIAVLSTPAQTERVRGVVKWFNPTRGMGFLTANGRDYSVHKSSLTANCNGTLHDGQTVSFDIRPGKLGETKGEDKSEWTASAASAINVTCK
jgi:CspA family cold shock protein